MRIKSIAHSFQFLFMEKQDMKNFHFLWLYTFFILYVCIFITCTNFSTTVPTRLPTHTFPFSLSFALFFSFSHSSLSHSHSLLRTMMSIFHTKYIYHAIINLLRSILSWFEIAMGVWVYWNPFVLRECFFPFSYSFQFSCCIDCPHTINA